ncbi:MAG TPA: SagB family peptide dehydrogenase [Thermoanaerobaculia bacterium]|jgi:SagB-type dehydrogenase family enzyme|nr:SagB family peptide dehydrogenase [Thermoanaerobaculia bacterium]
MITASANAVIGERMALRPDAQLAAGGDGSPVIRFQFRELPFPDLPPGARKALHAVATGPGLTIAEFIRNVTADGHAALPRGLWLLNELKRWALLSRTIEIDGRAALTAIPLGYSGSAPRQQGETAGLRILSRFAILRRDGADFVIESPLSHQKIVIHDAALLALTAELATAFDGEQLASRLPALDPAFVAAAVALLDDAGMLSAVSGDGVPSDEQAPWRTWDVHDLYFHSRSRRGRHSNAYGGTFRRIEDNIPALKPPAEGASIALETPDRDSIADPSFETVMQTRRSIRTHASTPMTRQQLGEFLYRSVRVIEHGSNAEGDWTRRRYPGAGGLYELEVYPVIGACSGIEPGLYHYRPGDHALTPLQSATPEVMQLLREGGITAAMTAPPQILFVITCRFARVSAKYESIAYSLCLKDAGVLMQTMYLVATAMGLAPCALGGGDSDLFARASTLPYLEEGAVAEFVLGQPDATGAAS